MRITAATFIALVAAHLACAANPTRIYVYAQRETPARSWFAISCGDTVVADIKRGTFIAIAVVPGRYTLGVENCLPVSLDVGSGEESLVRPDWNHRVDRPPIPALSKVRPAQAGKEMTYLIYVDARRVRSGSVAKSDPRELQQPQLNAMEVPQSKQ